MFCQNYFFILTAGMKNYHHFNGRSKSKHWIRPRIKFLKMESKFAWVHPKCRFCDIPPAWNLLESTNQNLIGYYMRCTCTYDAVCITCTCM
jgi:hypothetical protein